MDPASDDPSDCLQGWRWLRHLKQLLSGLHGAGAARDRAGNRKLHFDDYCLMLLLFFFNPALDSLRALQRASMSKKAAKTLGWTRTSLGSMSEAQHVFDPQLLQPIVAELARRAPTTSRDPRLQELKLSVQLVDGTLLKALPQITQAAWGSRKDRGWRLHTQFDLATHLPSRVDLTDGSNRGAANEKAVLRESLQPGRCYVQDRGYVEFSLFNAIVAADSSYVSRIREDYHFAPDEIRPLSDEANSAGVLEDAVGKLGSERSRRIEHPDHPVRRLRVQKRNPEGGHPGEVVLVTNLLDVPAEIIALLYAKRWQIELFFRFFKHVLGCRRLLAESPDGLQFQVYLAIIACLVMTLTVGGKPNKADRELFLLHMQGFADDEDLRDHLARRKPAK